MNFGKAWLVTKKDLLIMRKRKSILALMFVLPLLLSIGLPSLIDYLIIRKSPPVSEITELLGSFAYFFILISAFIPLYVSSYSIVGEKSEKSIEPLLAAPISDNEILLGKYIAVLLPALSAIYVAGLIFMTLTDLLTHNFIHYYYYPNWTFGAVMIVGVPLGSLYGVALGILVSSKTNNVQSSYQMGGITLIPFIILYVLGEVNIISLDDVNNILLICLGIFIAVIIVYIFNSKTFNRERIILNWK
ncbi:MAG: ABC transporter permease subunit [Thermoplasmatales archaeon]|nr:MAG: ABC transporter permease subunit [Thermoplasmatales archaeon]